MDEECEAAEAALGSLKRRGGKIIVCLAKLLLNEQTAGRCFLSALFTPVEVDTRLETVACVVSQIPDG